MEELYIENFSIKKIKTQSLENTSAQSIALEKPKEFDQSTHQMIAFLDQLEREITHDYKDFTDFRFLFEKIRKTLKKNSVEGILDWLADLEELLDLGVPSILHNKKMERG